MAYMLVRNKVRDSDVWKKAFDDELDRARAFTTDPASAAAGERVGALEGEIHYVEDVP